MPQRATYIIHIHQKQRTEDRALRNPRRNCQRAGGGSIDNYHLISITEEIGNPFNYQCINANIMQSINQQAMGDPVESLGEIQNCRVLKHSPVNRCHQTIGRRN